MKSYRKGTWFNTSKGFAGKRKKGVLVKIIGEQGERHGI